MAMKHERVEFQALETELINQRCHGNRMMETLGVGKEREKERDK